MPSRRRASFKSQRSAILDGLATQIRRKSPHILEENFIDPVERILEELYLRTVENWESHSDSGQSPTYPVPHPEFEWRNLKIKGELEISARIDCWMAGPGGEESLLWIWIDRGADYTMPVKSAPFRWRKSNRVGDGLEMGPFPGYREDDFGNEITTVLPEGWNVIHPGAGWTNKIGKEFKARAASELEARVRFRSMGRKVIGGI